MPALKAVVAWAMLQALALAATPGAVRQPGVHQIGDRLYAYISANDGSSNSTFLVGQSAILVVDTGVNDVEGEKLRAAIRKISGLPVKYIVNTHYHPDHQGGNAAVARDALVISTEYTRQRTLGLLHSPSPQPFQPAALTVSSKTMLYVDGDPVEIYFPGKAHTSGDLLVYFPRQRAIAMGDLFLADSCPAMDQGSVENWVNALDGVLQRPLKAVVPGHFELSSRKELETFRNYLNDLRAQVIAMKKQGLTLPQVRKNIAMEKYSGFRQYPQYEATFADNAASVMKELSAR